jgi:hypothetical protein
MIVRLAVVAAVLVGFVLLGMPWNATDGTLHPSTAAAAPAGAPAATTTNGLQFSTSVDSNARPNNPRTEFDGDTDDVWASFEYKDHDPNAKVSWGSRANGADYRWGTLDCCDNRDGRYAFQIRGRSGGLPGAAYDVRVYVNDVEVAQGGFGVRGRGGLDNDGQDEDNGNN